MTWMPWTQSKCDLYALKLNACDPKRVGVEKTFMSGLTLPILIAPLVLLAVANAARGQGGPPLITDDPNTPGDGKWEINLSYTVEKNHIKATYETPLLDINYGLGDRIQLKYELPLLMVDVRSEGLKTGLGDSLAGFKYRFLDEGKHGFAMSVYPQLVFNNPSRSVERGLVERGTNLLVPVEFGRTFGKFEVVVEVGYDFVQFGRDNWVYGVAVDYPLTEKLELLAEIHGTMDQDLHRNRDWVFNVGTRWAFGKNVGLLFS